jgi:hypothetical protein
VIEIADVRAQLERAWNDGSLLREWLQGAERWPWSVSARAPSGGALLERYDEVRNWIGRLEHSSQQHPGMRVEFTDLNVRKLGSQRVPGRVWVDSRDGALALIGKAAAFGQFERLCEVTRARNEGLLAWLVNRPLRALEHADAWDRLLDVADWFLAHPSSGLYLRQVDVPGTDTKFIETHLAVISELMDFLRPSPPLPAVGNPAHRMAMRLGLAVDPQIVRLRLLDPALVTHYRGVSDLALPFAEFAVLDPPCTTVFVTENKTNGLAFPPVPSALVIFGLGYGIETLRDVAWLRHRRLVYWGDIDTHGYHILSRCRAWWPHLDSLLMDETTLATHAPLAIEEPETARDSTLPGRLTDGERQAFFALLENRYGHRVRIEQERIPFGVVITAVERASVHADGLQARREGTADGAKPVGALR